MYVFHQLKNAQKNTDIFCSSLDIEEKSDESVGMEGGGWGEGGGGDRSNFNNFQSTHLISIHTEKRIYVSC